YHRPSSLFKLGWFTFEVLGGSLFNWKEFTFEPLSVHFSSLADILRAIYLTFHTRMDILNTNHITFGAG
ncbi:MAG: hypothetical protein M1281_08865, partial [Chloroflexi bacterium]|nr:hypothetical protein [Chloroflexota bacterium]